MVDAASSAGVTLVPSFRPPKSFHAKDLSPHDFIHSLLCLDPPWKPPSSLEHDLTNPNYHNYMPANTQESRVPSFGGDFDSSPVKSHSHPSQKTSAMSTKKKRNVDFDLTADDPISKKTNNASFDAGSFNLFDGALSYQPTTADKSTDRNTSNTNNTPKQDKDSVFDHWDAPPPVETKGFRSMNSSTMKPLAVPSVGKKSMFGNLLKASSSKVLSLIHDEQQHPKSDRSQQQSTSFTPSSSSASSSKDVFAIFKDKNTEGSHFSASTVHVDEQPSIAATNEKPTRTLPSLQSLLSSSIDSTSSKFLPHSSSSNSSRERPSQAIPVDSRVSAFFPDEHTGNTHGKSTKSSSSTRELKDTSLSFQMEDFKGIQQLCRNAGATKQGLQAFLHDCLPPENSTEEKTIAMALLFQDLSSNHATFSIKYCTPTSACYHWYCTCDRHIRTEAIRNHLIGALIVMPKRALEKDDRCYFLPLTTCAEEEEAANIAIRGLTGDYKQDLKSLPIRSETSVSQRWDAYFQIMYHPKILKVFYHTQVSLLPIINAWNHYPSYQQDHVEMFSQLYDVKIAEYLLNTDVEESELELHALFEKYRVEIVGSNVLESTSGQVTRSIAKVKDELVALLALFTKQNMQLEHHQLLILLHQIEMPTSCLLSAMELHGVHVNLQQYNTLRESLKHKLTLCEEEVYKLSGFQFNVASPEQVAHVLYDKLQLLAESTSSSKVNSTGNTASGKFHSTSEESLSKILHLHPVVQQILNYRSIMKLLSTYIEGIKPLLTALESRTSNPVFSQYSAKLTNRLHAYWNQTSTRTGRLSCCKPNLQNIPGNQTIDNIEYSMRALFISSPKKVIVTADYSQIEMRILAHVSNDQAMCQLFQHDGDVYRILAAKIMSKPAAMIDDDERNRAKVICLGVLYGMGPQAAAARLGIDINTASKITNSFFNNFPQVKSWIQRVKLLAKQHCHVKTIIGRTRQLLEINSTDAAKKSAAERQAVNSIIQGSASDLIKYAMIATVAEIKKWECSLDRKPLGAFDGVKLIMQIHDELIFEIPNQDEALLGRTIQLIKDVMEKAVRQKMNLKVPLIANISVGNTWGSTESWKPLA